MNNRRVITTAVVVATVGAAAALTLPALAGTNRSTGSTKAAGVATLSPAMRTALQRDLHLTSAQLNTRLAREAWAIKTVPTLRKALGAKYAGAWLSAGGTQLNIGVTDSALANQIKATGAQPKVVARSVLQLDSIKRALDRRATLAASTISGWHVDVATNTVVVRAKSRSVATARAFIASAGVPTSAVRIVATNTTPKLLQAVSPTPSDTTQPAATAAAGAAGAVAVRGGDAYIIDNVARCSVGFSVVGGFVSAGHCGQAGSTTAASDGTQDIAQGTFKASQFPDNDFSFIETNASFNPVAEVTSFGGQTSSAVGPVQNAGGQNAAGQTQSAAAGQSAATKSDKYGKDKYGKEKSGKDKYGEGQNASQGAADPSATVDPSASVDPSATVDPSASASVDPSATAAPPAVPDVLPVAGSLEAPVGTSVCKFGSTTGASCGTVLAVNATVRFADPAGGAGLVTVNGLTDTNACAEAGDSGGPFLAVDQAQGTVSGGSGDCSVGGETFFQPVNEVLQTLQLTLLTTAGAGGAAGAGASQSVAATASAVATASATG